MLFAAPRVRDCPLSLTQDLMYSGRTHETVARSLEACMYEKSQVLHRSLPSDPSFPYDYIPSFCNVNFQKLLLWDGAYFAIFHLWPAPGLSLASRPCWKWWDAHPKPRFQGTLQFPSIWWNPASVTWTNLRYLLKEDSHMKWSPFAPDEVILDQTAVSQAPNVTEHRTSAQQSFLSDPQLITDNMGLPIHLHKDRPTDSQSCWQY